MSPVVLGSVMGAAALTVGRGAATAVSNGLSFGAELLRAANGEANGAAGDKGAEAGGIPKELKQRIEELTARIRRQLATAGIQLTRPVELTSNGAGGIAVQGDHPLAAAIQAALGNDVLLERDFDHLASDYAEFAAERGTGDVPGALSILVSPSL